MKNNIIFENSYYFITQENNPIIKRMQLTAKSMSGDVYFYELFNGIVIAFINIKARSFPVPPAFGFGNEDAIFFNYCVKGRAEIVLSNGRSTCIVENEVSIAKDFAVNEFSYPQKAYQGIELFFDVQKLKKEQGFLIKDLEIDILSALELYSKNQKPYITVITPEMEVIISDLWELRNSKNIVEMKITVIKLLHVLSEKSMPIYGASRTYLTATQVKIVKAVETIITEDLQQNHTVLELANRFSLGESSLKNYFKAYYGQSITEYIREIRMNEAACLLVNTKLKIIDIATAIGYKNQSKFAAVFKKHFDCSPLEYRRLKKVEAGQF